MPSPLARAVTSWPSASSSASATSRRAACGVGVDRGSPRPRFWLASQPNPLLGLADRPAAAGGVAGEAAADVVAGGAEEGLAVALAEVAGLEQLQRLVGELEQADQVGDGGAAAADAAGQLLFGQAELLDQGGAGLRLLDRVEVLADHVLDQRRLQPLGLGLVADDRRHLLEPRLLGGAPAALAGDQLVAAVGEGADQQRLDDAAGLDRGGERRQRLRVEVGPRLRGVRLDQRRPAARAARPAPSASASGRIAARPRPIPRRSASHGSRAPWPGRGRRRRRGRTGACSVTGRP